MLYRKLRWLNVYGKNVKEMKRPTHASPFLHEIRNIRVVIRNECNLNIIHISKAKEKEKANAISKGKEKATSFDKGKENACPMVNAFVAKFRQAHAILNQLALTGRNLPAHLHYNSTTDRRQYNLPTTDEIVVVIPGDGTKVPEQGKRFLYNTIALKCRSLCHIVIIVASSGIASLLLVRGRTSRSTFSILLDVLENSICGFSKQSLQAELFRETKLIIWNEVPMQHRHCVEVVDRTLWDTFDSEKSFGGIVT
ncbi:uncharacterized protein LOC114285017 [Camellia sinensis]|uniref:uncharacterized protein LOC114285017 n=1 Tax=Camellia sinensis TaxID=4442 RepID=UPI001035C21F|nr:uncharacterized protein LOC114285017 [Camellia sinensis]